MKDKKARVLLLVAPWLYILTLNFFSKTFCGRVTEHGNFLLENVRVLVKKFKIKLHTNVLKIIYTD
jgi:hypothetical protein